MAEGSPFDGLGTRAVVLVREAGRIVGDKGMVKARAFDGDQVFRLTAFGEKDGSISALGRALLGLAEGQRIECAGRMSQDERYGAELVVSALSAA